MNDHKKLKTKIQHDEITRKICEVFTIEAEDHVFQPHLIEEDLIPEDFSVGLIVGSSGSGKSLLLKEFGQAEDLPHWENKAIASHFSSYEDAESRLMGAGLNSVPIWLAPYNILSNGQKYRADMARKLESGACFDEFTSVIDRDTSRSLANSIKKYIKHQKLTGVVFACPHHDIEEYLEPDWTYDTDTRVLKINSKTHEEQIHYLDKKYIKIDQQKKIHFMSFEI